jgi:hypothetical protein
MTLPLNGAGIANPFLKPGDPENTPPRGEKRRLTVGQTHEFLQLMSDAG